MSSIFLSYHIGSGKSTFIRGMREFMETCLGRRVYVVNLDPASNSGGSRKGVISIEDLITLEDVMEELGLGPNGGMVYCIEFLEKNADWLIDKMRKQIDKGMIQYVSQLILD